MNQHEPILHERDRLHLDPDEFVGERVGEKRKMEHERFANSYFVFFKDQQLMSKTC